MKTLMSKLSLTFVMVMIISALFGHRASAQFFTGGDVNFSFLDGITIDLAPTVGYKYKNFDAGISPIVQYTAANAGDLNGDFSFGGKIYAEYDIWKGLLAHVEFKALYTGYINTSGIKKTGWVIGSPIGLGYQRDLGNGFWIKALVLYDPFIDINLNQNSSLANPSVSGGINYVFQN